MIKKLIKKGFKNIWKHRLLFLIMFVMQIVFIGIISYVGVHYYLETMGHAGALLDQVEALTTEQILGMQVAEPYEMYEHYKAMIHSVIMGIVIGYLVFLLFDGIVWNLTNMMVNKARHLKDILWYHLKYVIVFSIFTIPLLLIILGLVKTIALTGSNVHFAIGTIVFSLIDAYFLAICLGICYEYKLKELMLLLKRTFWLGYKKAKILVAMSLIILGVYVAAGVLLYYSTASLGLLVLCAVLFILAVNWGRVTCMTTVRAVNKKEID